MSKHTPGPWVIRYKDAVYAQSGRFIADCELTPYDARPQPPNSTDAANAHLIAAAPAMLEALQQLAELQRKWRSDDENETIDSIEYLDEIDKILWTDIVAQATGSTVRTRTS